MSGEVDVALIGHPLAPIGRGEDIRSAFRAFSAHGARVSLLDVYRTQSADSALWQELADALETPRRSTIANVFFINGDEVESCLDQVNSRLPQPSRSIVCPAWELPIYPNSWIDAIERFDEVWAPSRFIAEGLAGRVRIPVNVVPLAVEPRVSRLVGRSYFGIPGSCFAFLFFFDFQSYAARKNPKAVMTAFGKLLRMRPFADVRLVVKIHNGERDPPAYAAFIEDAKNFGNRLTIIDKTMTDWEVKNLVRCCDCFVSLHRSEGFGRGLAESMYFRKPVIATGYSGNTDFMSEDAAILVPFRLIPVGAGEYPHWEGQSWADPDVEFAASAMARVLDDPAYRQGIARNAQRHIQRKLSHIAIGERYFELLATSE